MYMLLPRFQDIYSHKTRFFVARSDRTSTFLELTGKLANRSTSSPTTCTSSFERLKYCGFNAHFGERFAVSLAGLDKAL
jgi:hypothetical protein